MGYSLKQKIGAVAIDLPRFLWSMRPSSRHPWVFMHNRDERLVVDPSGIGVECDWLWTSDLHIAKVFPSLGRLLMTRALGDWRIEFRTKPVEGDQAVQASFIIGHRGFDRLPHLLLTLKSIAAQREIAFECIVVEQSAEPEVKDHLPSWVRYVHTPLSDPNMPYSRAWAFNVGAQIAQGDVLVFHDNDMLVAADYGREIIKRAREGYEAINLQRFIFYLNAEHSGNALSGRESLKNCVPESIMQNAEGGGSVALTREAYFAIGGFDESFIGWGGEDNEFWQRAHTRRVWSFGYLPFVHLWHANQSEKDKQERPTASLFESRSKIPAKVRIEELISRGFGNPLVCGSETCGISGRQDLNNTTPVVSSVQNPDARVSP